MQRQVLAECLTVGETYFFRDPAVFEQLATQVLAPLVARRREGSRQLRLWSAGCASGEEAWSLAMLVAGLLP
jgi:chemotaxis protein methyltransferase CheR